jgi:hypothetical protein
MKTILLILSLIFITSGNRNEEPKEDAADLVASWSLTSLYSGLASSEKSLTSRNIKNIK